MLLWVPAALLVLSLLIAATASAVSRRHERRTRRTEADAARYLIHAINDDRCTGCESCVSACPTNVLALVRHKSRAVRFSDCVQCEACARACPTQALAMHPIGTAPPPVRIPEVDANFQTAVPGQYLIGEAVGKPLVKNAANLGRFVIEHMVSEGLRPRAAATRNDVDVAIVGSGPAGLSAALTCLHHGLRCVVLEKEQLVASTVSRYPNGKPFMAEPADAVNLSFLPVFDTSKEDLIARWHRVTELAAIDLRRGEAVESVRRDDDGTFRIATTTARYTAGRVVLAIGTRGKPRTLGIPGENLAKVHSLLEDPIDFAGRRTLVVGGGDSAIEAALALAGAGATVTLAYRGRAFNRAKKKNRDAVERAAADGTIELMMQCNPTAIGERDVALKGADGAERRVPNDAVFVLIGADLPVRWLSKVGVEVVERPHSHQYGASDALVRTLVPAAAECPRDPAAAMAHLRGERIPRAHRRPERGRATSTLGAVTGAVRRVRAVSSRWVDSTVARLWDREPPRRAESPRHGRPASISGLDIAKAKRLRRIGASETIPTLPAVPQRRSATPPPPPPRRTAPPPPPARRVAPPTPPGTRRRFPAASQQIDVAMDFDADAPTFVRTPAAPPSLSDFDGGETRIVFVPRLR